MKQNIPSLSIKNSNKIKFIKHLYFSMIGKVSRRGLSLAGRQLSERPYNWASSGSMLDIGTRPIFNEDHDMFREVVRRFFKEQIEPHQMEWDKVGHVPREIWTLAGENGLLGVNCSDEVGGIGGDFLSTMIVAEEQQYIANSSIGWSLHSGKKLLIFAGVSLYLFSN